MIIAERTSSELYLGGTPAAPNDIYIRGDIRAGRTHAQREHLMLAMLETVSTIAAVDPTSVWINFCNLEPTDMIEYGHVLPGAGREQEWFDNLPKSLQSYPISLGTKANAFTL